MRTFNFYTFLISGFSILVVILLVFPQYQNWRFAFLRLQELEKESKNQEKYFERIREISKRLEAYQSVLAKIDNALPQSANLPQLFNFIQKVAGQNGLSLNKIGTIKTEKIPESKLKETKVELILSGDYQGLKNFLSVIEKSARLVEVESISFSYPEKKAQEKPKKEGEKKEEIQIFEFDLGIKVYHY